MVTIRPASEGDPSGLIELARGSWVSGFAHAPSGFVSAWLGRDFERDWSGRYWSEMFVAEECGALLGVVHGRPEAAPRRCEVIRDSAWRSAFREKTPSRC
jgi:hypothetical protein